MGIEDARGVELKVRKDLLSHNARAYVCVLLVALAFAWSVPLGAQGLAPSKSGLSVLGNAVAFDAAPGTASDLFIGANSKGPYYLTWKHIDPDTETITVDGMAYREGPDYAIDCNTGTVTFKKPLRAGSIVRAQYHCNPNKAVRNAADVNLPIDLNLLQSESSSLHLVGLYKGAALDKPTSGTSVVGLSGAHKQGASGVNAMFLFSSSPDMKGHSGGTWDRAALKIGGSREAGRLRLKASYEQAGGDFAGSNEYGLKQGIGAANIAATYAASDRLTLSHSYTGEENISDAAKGTGKSTTEQTVSYAPDEDSTVAASRKVVETRGANGTDETMDQNKVDAAHTFNGGTSAAVSVTTSAISSGNTEVSKETTAGFNVQSGDKIEVQGTHTAGDSAVLGKSSSTKVSVSARPTGTIKVDADVGRAESDKAGGLVSAGVRVEANPSERLRLELQQSSEDSSILGSETSRLVRVEARPNKKISLQAGMTQRVASSDESDVTREARLELRPGSWLTLMGGVRTRELGSDVSTVMDVSGAVKPLKYLSLNGGYIKRDMPDATASVDTVALNLALDTTSYLKVLGSYQRNPEDAVTHQPLAVDNRSLAVESTLGRFSLTGGYARKTDNLLRSLSAEKQLGLGIQVSRHGRLVSGFRRTEAVLGSQLLEETYSIGYSRQMGSDFSLLLSGSMTRSQLDGVYLNDRPEVQAEAKLGLKF